MMRSTVFSALLLLLLTLTSLAGDSCLRLHLIRALGEHAFMANDLRNSEEEAEIKKFYLLYKNDDRFYHWIMEDEEVEKQKISRILSIWNVAKEYYSYTEKTEKTIWDFKDIQTLFYTKSNFSHEDKRSKMQKIWDIISLKKYSSINDRTPFNRYDEQVLLLRKGDVVRYYDKAGKIKEEVTLGNYLGAGNTNHIFEIEGKPGEVIRIPFVADFLASPRNSAQRFNESQGFASQFLSATLEEKIKKSNIPHSKIISHGARNEYTIATKINGKESGDFFAERLALKDLTIENMSDSEFKNDPDAIKLLELYHYASEYSVIYNEIHPKTKLKIYDHFSHFVWSEDSPKGWFLVDRE